MMPKRKPPGRGNMRGRRTQTIRSPARSSGRSRTPGGENILMFPNRKQPAGDSIDGEVRLREALKHLHTANDNFTVGIAISFLTVAMFEGRSAREYAEMLGLGTSSMSRHLLDLGDINRKREPGMRLIEQRPDPMDRRKNVYRLTAKGRALIAKINEALS